MSAQQLTNTELVESVAGSLGAAETHTELEVELADRLGAAMREIEELTSTIAQIREKFGYWES